MILMTIIRVMTGTALVLGLSACHPVWWAAEALAFEKRGEFEYGGTRYSLYYQSRAGRSYGTPVQCVNGRVIEQSGEIVVWEVADMGMPLLVLERLNQPAFDCLDLDNWKTQVYPIAAAACRSIGQTPKLLENRKQSDASLNEDGSIEIWRACV